MEIQPAVPELRPVLGALKNTELAVSDFKTGTNARISAIIQELQNKIADRKLTGSDIKLANKQIIKLEKLKTELYTTQVNDKSSVDKLKKKVTVVLSKSINDCKKCGIKEEVIKKAIKDTGQWASDFNTKLDIATKELGNVQKSYKATRAPKNSNSAKIRGRIATFFRSKPKTVQDISNAAAKLEDVYRKEMNLPKLMKDCDAEGGFLILSDRQGFLSPENCTTLILNEAINKTKVAISEYGERSSDAKQDLENHLKSLGELQELRRVHTDEVSFERAHVDFVDKKGWWQ